MQPIKPQLPKGMRDYLPADMIRRQYVMDTIAGVFQLYGYEPLQTPVMELKEMLTGKYGDEADKLIYYAQHAQGKEELALRYDLTVPLARAFAQHESELSLPFKRYQMAPVWRGERPGQGRYREFYQCDADIVGIAGMEADAEGVSVVVTALQRLGFTDFRVKINNRKVLTGIGQYVGLSGDVLANLYRSIDKFDKIGAEGVKEDLSKNGIAPDTIGKIAHLLFESPAPEATGFSADRARLGRMREVLANIPVAQEGLSELAQLYDFLEAMRTPEVHVELDFLMVRGLSYYTGPIFETVLTSNDAEDRVGSVSGGGRYDGLIGLFRRESLPTVGISLGIERLIFLMNKWDMYPETLKNTVVQVLVTVFGPETRHASLKVVSTLRAAGINAELFMQDARIGKQLGYADRKGIPLVAILGPDEMSRGEVKFKRLADQHETVAPQSDAARTASALLGS